MDADATDDDLLDRAQRGDQIALQAVLIREGSFLKCKIADELARCGVESRSEVDDVLQEVWLRVARSLSRFEPQGEGSWAAWLKTISVNAARSHAERMHRGGRLVPAVAEGSSGHWSIPLLDDLAADSSTPSRGLAAQELESELESAIAELPNEHRQAVQLRYLQGLSIQEGAGHMNCSPGQFRGYLQRGLKELRASPRLRKFLS